MELEKAIRRRQMTREFSSRPLDVDTTKKLLDLARRAPSAGNTQAVEFIVLNEPAAVEKYWDTTLPPARRQTFRWQQLLAAPTLVILTVKPESYVERYAEADKDRSQSLGQSTDSWSVPFWWVDAGAVAQNLLLLAASHGLGACLFGLFDHEPAVKQAFGIPAEIRTVATVALGFGLDEGPKPEQGRSAARPRPPIDRIMHVGEWGQVAESSDTLSGTDSTS